MSDRSIDRITFLLNANREAGRKLQEELERHRQEQGAGQGKISRSKTVLSSIDNDVNAPKQTSRGVGVGAI